jgi:hypothetical protein
MDPRLVGWAQQLKSWETMKVQGSRQLAGGEGWLQEWLMGKVS